MAHGLRNNLIARSVGRVPVLKRLPIFKLIALGEIAILAKDHLYRLEPQERKRLVALVQTSRGRTGNLSETERRELAELLGKMDTRAFAGNAADRLSPVPLPKRFTHGPKAKRKAREREDRERRQRSAA
jgi:hypothetical protein